MKPLLLNIIMIFILAELLTGQEQWTAYSTSNTGSNGLCSNNIETIHEDHSGNLWIGTFRGLNIFDGKEWETIANRNLPDDHITDIHEDKNGNIWISTYGGIGRFDGSDWTVFTTEDALPNKNVLDITEDTLGNLWFATYGGIVKYDGMNWISYLESNGLVLSSSYHSILADRNGNIWASNEAGGLLVYRDTVWEDHYLSAIRMFEDSKGTMWLGATDGYYIDGTYSQIPEVTDNWISCISEDKQGNIWFGLYANGAATYDGSDWTFLTTADGLPSDRVQTLSPDDKGNIWIGTDKGLVKYDGENCIVYNTNDGLADNVVLEIAEDNKGNMWFVTYAAGCSVFNGVNWYTLTNENEIPSKYDRINTIKKDQKGNMWLGTSDGACKFNGEKWTFQDVTADSIDNRVLAIAVDLEGHLWFGKFGTGISCLSEEGMKHYSVADGLLTDYIEDIAVDPQGNIWLAHLDSRMFSSAVVDWSINKFGISKFDGTEWHSYTIDDTSAFMQITTSIAADRNGKIWVGTMNKLLVFDEHNWQDVTAGDGLTGGWITSLFEDSRGFIWAGTSQGVCCFDGSGWISYSDSDRLADSFIRSICEDNRGNMWFGTNEGVSMLDFDSAGYVINYALPDLVSYYTNPVSDILRIKLNNYKQKSLILEIFNMYGQIVCKRYYNSQEYVIWDEIDLSALASGIYLFRVTQDRIKETEKIILSHSR